VKEQGARLGFRTAGDDPGLLAARWQATYFDGAWRAAGGGGGGATGGGQARRAGGHAEERGRDDAAGRGGAGKKPLDPRMLELARSTGEVGGRSRAALAARYALGCAEGTLAIPAGVNRQRCETRDRHSPGEELMKRDVLVYFDFGRWPYAAASLPEGQTSSSSTTLAQVSATCCCTWLGPLSGSSSTASPSRLRTCSRPAASGQRERDRRALGVISGDGGTTVSLWSNRERLTCRTELGSWEWPHRTEPFRPVLFRFDDFGPAAPASPRVRLTSW